MVTRVQINNFREIHPGQLCNAQKNTKSNMLVDSKRNVEFNRKCSLCVEMQMLRVHKQVA